MFKPSETPARELCVHEQFDIQAALTPEAAAVIGGGPTVRYAELRRMSSSLAYALP